MNATTTNLQRAFRWHRQNVLKDSASGRATCHHAWRALELARLDVAAGKKRYPNPPRHAALGAAFAGYGTQQMRWCESPADIGLRFVGYADKLARIDHTGWWCDEYGDSTVRGVVYQLPARNGRPVYVSGYDNADNGAADNGGPAAIDFGTLWYGEPGGNTADSDHYGEHRSAAYHADKLAERMAESERDYNRAWQAGSQWATLGDDIATTRKALLAMLAERRQARAAGANYPALCAALAGKVSAMLADIGAWRAKRDDYAAGNDDSLGFYTGDSELRAAFNDGAEPGTLG